MNLLLFDRRECDGDRLVIRDRRFRHLRSILAVSPGDKVRVGEINGRRGSAVVASIDEQEAALVVVLDAPPPPVLPLSIVLALPRPKMLRRLLRAVAELGVKDLHLVHSYRVEKSFWQSPLLAPAALREALLAGLEQTEDTLLPTVHQHRRFRPFAEDTLPGLARDRTALLADPGAAEVFPATPALPGLLAIGPEGGFIDFERALLREAGLRPVQLGARILRVETALHCALGRYLPGPAGAPA